MTKEKKQVDESTTTQVQEETALVEENVEKQEEQETETVEEAVVAEEAKDSVKDVAAEEVKDSVNAVAADDEKEEVTDEVEKKETAKEESKDVEEEEVVRLEDLTEETEYSQEEINFLTQMYDKTLHEIKQGDIVKGKILDVTESDVLVDIGFKSEGIIPGDEFDDLSKVVVGEELEVFLENVEDPNGQLILSRRRADFIRVWENVVQKFENNETISGTIVRRIKGGMVVTLNGVDAFLPGSQIDVKPIRDFDAYLGKDLDFKIVKVNHIRRNIVVSSRVLIEKRWKASGLRSLKRLKKARYVRAQLKTSQTLVFLSILAVLTDCCILRI